MDIYYIFLDLFRQLSDTLRLLNVFGELNWLRSTCAVPINGKLLLGARDFHSNERHFRQSLTLRIGPGRSNEQCVLASMFRWVDPSTQFLVI